MAAIVYHWRVMADSKLAALSASAAAPFTTTLERVPPHTKLIGLLALAARFLRAPAER